METMTDLREVMKRIVWALLLAGLSLRAGERQQWWFSVAALGAATAADTMSSQGRTELNPGLATNGQLGVRGFAVKCSIAAAIPLAQWLILRKRPGMQKPFTLTNYGVSGVWTGAAVHNWRIPAGSGR